MGLKALQWWYIRLYIQEVPVWISLGCQLFWLRVFLVFLSLFWQMAEQSFILTQVFLSSFLSFLSIPVALCIWQKNALKYIIMTFLESLQIYCCICWLLIWCMWLNSPREELLYAIRCISHCCCLIFIRTSFLVICELSGEIQIN
jgi:hypothetical protein